MATSQQRLNGPQGSYGATDQPRGGGSFEQLSREVSNSVFKINNNATVLERQARKISTKEDDPQLREKLHDIQQETNRVAGDVTSQIKRLHDLSGRDRPKKLQVNRLANSFKSTLERYQGIQRKVSDQIKSESLFHDQQTHNIDEGPDTWSDEAVLVEQNRRKEQLIQQQIEVEDDLALARDREERIRALENDVLDVNDIFRQLGTMIHEQGEIVDDIESNVVNASDNVNEGNVQLHKAVEYQKSYRKKLCILAVIFVIVAGIIALILGLTLSKKN